MLDLYSYRLTNWFINSKLNVQYSGDRRYSFIFVIQIPSYNDSAYVSHLLLYLYCDDTTLFA